MNYKINLKEMKYFSNLKINYLRSMDDKLVNQVNIPCPSYLKLFNIGTLMVEICKCFRKHAPSDLAHVSLDDLVSHVLIKDFTFVNNEVILKFQYFKITHIKMGLLSSKFTKFSKITKHISLLSVLRSKTKKQSKAPIAYSKLQISEIFAKLITKGKVSVIKEYILNYTAQLDHIFRIFSAFIKVEYKNEISTSVVDEFKTLFAKLSVIQTKVGIKTVILIIKTNRAIWQGYVSGRFRSSTIKELNSLLWSEKLFAKVCKGGVPKVVPVTLRNLLISVAAADYIAKIFSLVNTFFSCFRCLTFDQRFKLESIEGPYTGQNKDNF